MTTKESKEIRKYLRIRNEINSAMQLNPEPEKLVTALLSAQNEVTNELKLLGYNKEYNPKEITLADVTPYIDGNTYTPEEKAKKIKWSGLIYLNRTMKKIGNTQFEKFHPTLIANITKAFVISLELMYPKHFKDVT